MLNHKNYLFGIVLSLLICVNALSFNLVYGACYNKSCSKQNGIYYCISTVCNTSDPTCSRCSQLCNVDDDCRCTYKQCSTQGACVSVVCNEPHADQCSSNLDCVGTVKGNAIINSNGCQNGTVTLMAQVNGGSTPYESYEWFYKKSSDLGWPLHGDYLICGSTSCSNSHSSTNLSNGSYDFKLQITGNDSSYFASNILSVNCVNGGSSNHCGINPNGSMFCGIGTLGLVGTGTSCTTANDCGTCKKR
jgi:hypothetical protein